MRLPESYRIDPDDPRAPTIAEWEQMTPEERAYVVEALPSEEAGLFPPEGDPHRKAKSRAAETLDDYYHRIKRSVYISSELGIYYPGEPRFSPDLIAVLDVEPHERSSWVVLHERKGIDLALEVVYAGDRAKDAERNVKWYARLGIQEYFIFDIKQCILSGYRLPSASAGEARTYRPILPQGGRYASAVLGLDLVAEGSKLRFFLADTPLLEGRELITRLELMVDDVLLRQAEAERRAQAEAARAADLEQKLRETESRLAKVETELARLKSGR